MEQCLKDYQAYDPLSTVYSDHKIVVTKLRLSLLANGKTTAKRTSFDWHCFSTSHSVREAYTVEVKNRFEALYELEEKHTVNDLYTTMIEAQMDAAEKCIPKKKRVKKRVPWEKELVKEKRNELKKAYLKNKRPPNSDNANYLKQAKEELHFSEVASGTRSIGHPLKRFKEALKQKTESNPTLRWETFATDRNA